MDTINLFKKLIVIDLLIAVIMIIASLFSPEEYVNFTLNSIVLMSEITFGMFSLIFLFLYFVSLYLCYKFNSLGKNLYIITFVGGNLLLLFTDVAMTGLETSLMSLGGMLSGMIIYMLVFTDVKDRFQ